MTDRDPNRPPGRDATRDWSDTLAQRLFAQRVVLLHGALDDVTATRAAAELMTLDAEGDGPISLRVDGAGGMAGPIGAAGATGSLTLALTLMDVIELLGVPVQALCLGLLGAPAIGVVAVCSGRAAMPSTRFHLREPDTQMEVHARDVAQWSDLRADERGRFCARLASATGRSEDEVAAHLGAGIFLGADDAVGYGIIDEVCRPDAPIHQLPGPPMGFHPRR
jgi:ATP-dependent Clp protease, protease subunit